VRKVQSHGLFTARTFRTGPHWWARAWRDAGDIAAYKELGIEPEHQSRLENGRHPIAEPMDKLNGLVHALSADDPELLNYVSKMLKSWLADWTKHEAGTRDRQEDRR